MGETIRTDPYRVLDFEAPTILVGAGRSGSTILDAMIGAHPLVYSIGEVSFLLHRMWDTLEERKSYYRTVPERLGRQKVTRDASVTLDGFGPRNFAKLFRRILDRRYIDRLVLSWKDVVQIQMKDFPYGRHYQAERVAAMAREEIRLPRELGASFARLMIPPELVLPHWQFREIWIGSPAFPYDYSLFKTVFPKARYVQSIRHPIDYLDSAIKTLGGGLDDDGAVHHLSGWVAMVERARELALTQSYFEIRYEDVVGEAEGPLGALFRFLDLELHVDCLKILDLRMASSEPGPPVAENATRWIDATPGLRPIMEGLGYPDRPYGKLREKAKPL